MDIHSRLRVERIHVYEFKVAALKNIARAVVVAAFSRCVVEFRFIELCVFLFRLASIGFHPYPRTLPTFFSYFPHSLFFTLLTICCEIVREKRTSKLYDRDAFSLVLVRRHSARRPLVIVDSTPALCISHTN